MLASFPSDTKQDSYSHTNTVPHHGEQSGLSGGFLSGVAIVPGSDWRCRVSFQVALLLCSVAVGRLLGRRRLKHRELTPFD